MVGDLGRHHLLQCLPWPLEWGSMVGTTFDGATEFFHLEQPAPCTPTSAMLGGRCLWGQKVARRRCSPGPATALLLTGRATRLFCAGGPLGFPLPGSTMRRGIQG
eukprot:2109681-Lingulodinium_polyedra.AAC.1